MLIIFHGACNFPTFFGFVRRKITSTGSNVSTVTQVLYLIVVESGGISIKEVFFYIIISTPPSRLSPVRLSPDFQDLSKRVRLSPAFFAYHFQDLTEQDLIKLDLMI